MNVAYLVAKGIIFPRSNRYVNETVLEHQLTNRSPIEGYKDEEMMSLQDAVEKVGLFAVNVQKYVDDAKQKCHRTSDLLTWDESAAIYLYTMSTPFFSRLNEALRAENRHQLKPWFAFLKLFLSALEKLPSSVVTVWRAVAGDIGSSPVENSVKIWWGVNSSSTALNVVECFLGDLGTIFSINAIHGEKIHEYSAFPDEKEVILMPGTRVQTTSEPLNFKSLLRIIHLQEITIEQIEERNMIEPISQQRSTDISRDIDTTDRSDVPLINPTVQ